MIHILVADDDPNIQELLHFYLAKEGYQVFQAFDGDEANEILESKPIHLAIVDVMMPKKDGFELCEDIRTYYEKLPVIFLTAKGELEDKSVGFQLGADDYVVKPFEPQELLLRIKALLRRYQINTEKKVQIGELVIDTDSYEVVLHGEKITLPLKEFQLLHYLGSNPNRTFTREQLIEAVWGIDFEGDNRTVDVHIKRLREKFNETSARFTIQTIRGLGYKLEEK